MKKIATEYKWAVCPKCGAKLVIYDDTANSHGVHLKCTRGCREVVELIIEEGEQKLE